MANTGAEVIRYVYDVTGNEALAGVAKTLVSVGDISDETADAVRKLADEFAKVQQASAAASAYDAVRAEQDRLSDSTDRLGLRLKLAVQDEAALRQALAEKKAATEAAISAQEAYRNSEDRTTAGTRAHADAVRAAKAEQAAATAALKDAEATLADSTREYEANATAQEKNAQQLERLTGQLAAAGKGTNDLDAAQQSLGQRSAEITATLGTMAAKLQEARDTERALADEAKRGTAERAEYNAALERTRAATEKAKRETKGLSDEANTATGVFNRLKGILAGLLSVFSVASLVKGIKAIIGAGNEAEQALGQLNATLASTSNAAGLTGDELLKMAEKARASSNLTTEQIVSAQTRLLSYTSILRGEFPDALQVTIDQAQRLGISVEQSAEIVGKALQSPSDAMSSLARQGFKLEEGQKTLLKQLEATGRTAEAQRIILDMLSESYGGAAAAARIGTMQGLWKGLTDQVGAFIKRISDSGVFEYLKGQLVTLNETIERMTADGSLDVWAKRISDALIGTAEAIKGTIKFVTDYIGVLGMLAKAYALVKVESFLSGLASIASGATKASAAVQLLSLAITKIPGIRLLIIGGAAIALLQGQLDDLAKKIAETSDAGGKWKARLEELRAETSANAERFGQAAKALEGFGQVQLKTADQTAELSAKERAAYAENLAGLQRYLTLQIKYYEQLKAGNGLTEEGAQYLDKLRERLAEATRAGEAFKAGVKLAGEAVANNLTPGAQKLVGELDNITQSTALASERIKTLFGSFENKTYDQLGDIALALQHLADDSDVAGRRIRDGLAAELKNLSGEQLLRFQQSAQIAFEETGRSGEQAAVVLETTLQSALDKLGVSAAASGAQVTASGRDMIATYTAVAENARSSGAQIEAAFRAAAASASTKAELDQLGANLEAAANRGTISAQQTERAMVALRARVRELAEEANPLADAFARLGVTSQQALNDARDSAVDAFRAIVAGAKEGLATQEDVRQAWIAQAKAQLDAAANLEPWKRAQVEAQLATEAATYRSTDALAQLGISGAQAGQQVAQGMATAAQSTEQLTSAAAGAEARIVQMAENATTTVGDLIYQLNKANTSYAELGEAGKAAFDKVAQAQSSGAGGVTGVIASMANDWSAYFSGISQGAADAFRGVLSSANNAADGTSLAIGRYLGALSDGSVRLKERIAEQQTQVDQLLNGYQQFGDVGGSSLGIVERAATATAGQVGALLGQLQSARQSLDLLDKGRVDGLDTAIKTVEARLQSLRDAAANAKRELAETAASLQDDLDQQDGKAADIEQRRYQRQVAQIEELARKNDIVGSAEHRQALANAKELHDRKMADIQAQQEAAAKATQADADAQRAAAEAARIAAFEGGKSAAAAQASAAATSQAATAATTEADAAERAASARERSAAAAQTTAAAAGNGSSTSTSANRSELIVTIKPEPGAAGAQTIDITNLNEQQKASLAQQLTPFFVRALQDAMRSAGV